MKKPYAKPTGHVCGVCGVDWKKHETALKAGQKIPTLETCIEVLMAELRQARSFTAMRSFGTAQTGLTSIALGPPNSTGQYS